MAMTSSSLYLKEKHQFWKVVASKRRRPRRELSPQDLRNLILKKDGDKPTVNDVITRGGDSQNTYERNKRYWRRVLAERRGYTKLGNYEHAAKNAVAESIYEFILSFGGRFLQLDAKSGRWTQLSRKASMREIHQGLNGRYVPYFARLQRSTAVSRPDITAFEAFLKEAPSSHQNQRSNFLSKQFPSSRKSSASEHFMACVHFGHNGAQSPQVPISMRAYLEEKMKCVFSTSGNSKGGSFAKREAKQKVCFSSYLKTTTEF